MFFLLKFFSPHTEKKGFPHEKKKIMWFLTQKQKKNSTWIFFSLCERKKVLMKKNTLLISSHDNKDKAVCGLGKKKKVFTEKINILLSSSNTSKVLENMYIYFSLFVLTRKEKKSYRNFFFKFTRFLTENNTFLALGFTQEKKKGFPHLKKN